MTTALQRVRQLQAEINAREAQLAELTQQPEYIAEQSFIQDLLDVLEMHGRTLKEAVLAIDPSLLAGAAKAPKAPKAKRPYTPRKPKDVETFTLKPEPAPKVSPFASFGEAGGSADTLTGAAPIAEHPLEPEPKKAAKPAKKSHPSKNAKRNAERRVEMIREGRWFLYTNPHTGETEEASRQHSDVLQAWAAEFGKVTVESWKRPITPEEAGL